eukprot:CAMPEP_0185343956 /NCGR_PEP_ID=MMETSP1363-20130426/99884_1 /TAXON_ID=38817 /ORGANISM="Gephyrocapsa oceanica, Strain RCC1303" /LENGTH=278 /DNA_ID=CAMNT_0027943183 /DNA_START=252 /DNA_END=1088 /DNA_ORIENTATION=+
MSTTLPGHVPQVEVDWQGDATLAGAGGGQHQAVRPAAAAVDGETKKQLEALNDEFLQWVEEEWEKGEACDWSSAVRDYVKQRESLLGGGAGVKAPLGGAMAPACSAPGGAGAAAAPAADAGGGAGGGAPEVESGEGVDEKWKGSTKLSVYRTEKKNGEGELVQEKGWKSIGKGMLRLLAQEGVHFLEFRPLVSESSSAANDEPSDEVGAKREKYGRAVLSARLLSSTTFTVAKRSIQTNLWSSNAGGEATYSRYNIPLLSDEQANAFAELARGCVPKE